jgi:hypothetical protein
LAREKAITTLNYPNLRRKEVPMFPASKFVRWWVFLSVGVAFSAVTNRVEAQPKADTNLIDSSTNANRTLAKSEVLPPSYGDIGLPVRPFRPLRSKSEIRTLYATSIFYGMGSGILLGGSLAKRNQEGLVWGSMALGGALLPTVVALVDSVDGFTYGVPQSISTGIHLGMLQSFYIVLSLNGRSRANNSDFASEDRPVSRQALAVWYLWVLPTTGGLVGGLMSNGVQVTPGQASMVGTSGIWTSLIGMFAVRASQENRDVRAQSGHTAGAVFLPVGTVAGLLLAPTVSPSLHRVHAVDIGAAAGLLAGWAVGELAVPKQPRTEAGLMAGGITLGIGTALLLTTGMKREKYPKKEKQFLGVTNFTPSFSPTANGWKAGIQGVFF